MGKKRKNLKEKEDRISALPDAIIQHILFFLPSTKQAIQTSVLSKRWQKQWTHVPVLIFHFPGMPSDEDISRICRFIDNTLVLHDCSKIKKFQFKSSWYNFTVDPNYIAKLRFPIRKEVEELILDFNYYYPERNKLPNFFFNNTSLIKLQLNCCTLIPNGSVNWERLKDLYLEHCQWSNCQAIEGVLSGSPLLESLVINYCQGFDRLAIASKSLKRLVLVDPVVPFVLDVSCPNLVEFRVTLSNLEVDFHLSDGAVKSVLSGSPLLELLQLDNCVGFTQLVIDSNSLKKLVLVDTNVTDATVISCPNLEELHLYSLDLETVILLNMPSSVCTTIDFNCETWLSSSDENFGKMILEQLHHVKELNIGPCFIKILSLLEMRGVFCPSINSKCLTLDGGPNFVENLPGIAYALRSSPELEKLVIILRHFECATPHDFPDLNVSKENYWNSKGTVFNCLVSHLKIVKIFGFSENDDQLNLALNFVEFLLKNARVLEKMVIILEDRGADFVFKVSQKLLSFSRFSRHAIVELLCSESPRISKYANHG